MTDFMQHKAADAAVHAPSVGDEIQARVRAEKGLRDCAQALLDMTHAKQKVEQRIAQALAHIGRDLDTLEMESVRFNGILIETSKGMLTDLKQILTQ